MFKAFHIPLLQWSIYVKGWDPSFDDGPRWAYWRGRCLEHSVRVPVWRWSVEFHSAGKSYRELVGMPKVSLDWIIDEFDHSFNHLAIASMRYHMDYAVTHCPPDRRALFQGLIDRLSESRPRIATTPQDRAVLDAHWDKHGLDGVTISDPEVDAIHDDFWSRQDAYHERIQQARRDFIDVLPHLWS